MKDEKQDEFFEIDLGECRPLPECMLIPANSRRLNRSTMDNELKENNINGSEAVTSGRSMQTSINDGLGNKFVGYYTIISLIGHVVSFFVMMLGQ